MSGLVLCGIGTISSAAYGLFLLRRQRGHDISDFIIGLLLIAISEFLVHLGFSLINKIAVYDDPISSSARSTVEQPPLIFATNNLTIGPVQNNSFSHRGPNALDSPLSYHSPSSAVAAGFNPRTWLTCRGRLAIWLRLPCPRSQPGWCPGVPSRFSSWFLSASHLGCWA